MQRVQLISEETIKKQFPIKNVDAGAIEPGIQVAQDMGLQQLIGTCLYDTICSKVKDGTIITESDYKLLLDEYVQPYLLWQTMYELVPIAFAKIRNAGVVQSVTDHVQAMTHQDADYTRNDFASKANAYAGRLTAYIVANHTKYPEYSKRRDSSDMAHDSNAIIDQFVL
jgi:hypothetical protein